uniref:Uncharacterized protein n=1 Tax=Tanacetum cinerariifolium TaxID=118510 RepID=A0A6L2LEI9_TANCI|nr:hypothetical protein [Tanacetum cinerariifolium]
MLKGRYKFINKIDEALRMPDRLIYQGDKIIARDKTNKPKDEDKENDEQVTGRTKGFFYEPITKKKKKVRNVAKREREFQEKGTPCSCDDCGTISSNNDEHVASSKA